MDMALAGIIAPVVTPFRDDESIDEDALRRIIIHLMEHGADCILVCGCAGEGYALEDDEKIRCLDTALEAVEGAVPVLFAAGSNTTGRTCSLVKRAEEHGADAVTLKTPYCATLAQEELFEHFRAVLADTSLPVIIENAPRHTGVTITPGTTALLVEAADGLDGIIDASGDMVQTLSYKRYCGDAFRVFMGCDQLIYTGLMAGFDGAVAVSANIAVDIVVGILHSFQGGMFRQALEYQEQLAPLCDFIDETTFPAAVKEAMNLHGLHVGPCRRPVYPLNPEQYEKLERILLHMDLLDR